MTPREKAQQKLLTNRIIDSNGCWLWTGGKQANGYGKIRFGTGHWTTHRLSLFVFKPGEFSLSENVLHKPECNNPSCFNPEHLYSGTQTDNMQDRIKSGNNPELNKTHCIHGHEYTIENTYINKQGHRSCMACRNLHDAGRPRKVRLGK
jgi:hypothetical protein